MLKPNETKKSDTKAPPLELKSIQKPLSDKAIRETLQSILGQVYSFENLQEASIEKIHEFIRKNLWATTRDQLDLTFHAIRICNLINNLPSEHFMFLNAQGAQNLEIQFYLLNFHIQENRPLKTRTFHVSGRYFSNYGLFYTDISVTAPLLFAMLNPDESRFLLKQTIKAYEVAEAYVKILRELFFKVNLEITPAPVRAQDLDYADLRDGRWDSKNKLEPLVGQILFLASKDAISALKINSREQGYVIKWVKNLINSTKSFDSFIQLEEDIRACPALENIEEWFSFLKRRPAFSPKQRLLDYAASVKKTAFPHYETTSEQSPEDGAEPTDDSSIAPAAK